jgi:addiction module HigA family antidote
MSGSKIITEGEGTKGVDLLENVHPGDVLRHDFQIGAEISISDVASGAGVDAVRLEKIMARKLAMDANTDLRLSRYFGISEGLFLGLQIDFDLENERRAHGAELDRIVKRAA